MKITHASLIVKDQEEALAFFINKLDFEKKEDMPMGPDRWLTVSPKGQSFEIILQMPHWGPEKATKQDREAMIGKQSFALGSDNIEKDYAYLQKKGVEIIEAPKAFPWGKQMIFADLYGNPYVVVQVIQK